MKLTFEQGRAFEDWLRRKVEHPVCGLCQSTQWRMGELIPFGDHLPTEPVGAMAQLVCRNCGQVLLFDATQVGVARANDVTTDLM